MAFYKRDAQEMASFYRKEFGDDAFAALDALRNYIEAVYRMGGHVSDNVMSAVAGFVMYYQHNNGEMLDTVTAYRVAKAALFEQPFKTAGTAREESEVDYDLVNKAVDGKAAWDELTFAERILTYKRLHNAISDSAIRKLLSVTDDALRYFKSCMTKRGVHI